MDNRVPEDLAAVAVARVGTVGIENVFTLFATRLAELVDATGPMLLYDKDLAA